MGGRVACAFFLICAFQCCFCQSSYPLPVSPSSVAVNTENGEVFIAAGSKLLRLNNSLHLLENVTVSGGGELVVIALSPDSSRLVGCLGGDSRTCLVYDSQNLTSGETATVSNAHYNPENGLAIITTDESFYLGSEGGVEGAVGTNDNIYLAEYNYTSATVRTTGDMRFRVQTTNFIRRFYGGVSRNGYVYYFVADEDPTAVRVLRVCDCARETCSSEFDALYEMTVLCRSASETTRVCGVDLLESFADQNGPLVVMTQCDDGGNRNRACVFLLSDIDNPMDTFYTTCRDSVSDSFELPWDTSRSCNSEFNPMSPCNFGTPPAIDVESQLFGFYLVNLGETIITASLAINVDDVSLLYVATSEGIDLYEVSATGDVNNPTGGDSVDTIIIGGSSVRDISWEEGSDYITVTTTNEVSLYPLETCSTVRTCIECTKAGPLCGWCTVENKCSRRSQCQNSSEQRRWVDSFDQCINTTVTPDQFVLDTPTILNVTATPPLPSNLTYNCSFSANGDIFPLLVEAVEVVAGTMYQCDITAAITDLDSVREVTDFSFVSVEVGIPFATSEGALTIYDCNDASSCGECVLTENVCGWCLYGGLCSGTPDLCPVPAGVNNSYLMFGSSSGYDDVCPVVMAASTPSGHYTQPVNVARNLTLYTRNLPPPVEDFHYECSVRGQPLPATVNTSDGTVSCYIAEGVVTSSSSQEVVSLELIWTNDNVTYPLNENSTDDIMCILYNCGELLATGCSSCLGRNTPGFQCGWCSNECTVMEECSMDNVFFTSSDQCPSPAITSVQPKRGPVQGGTLVTLAGTDLGTTFTNIVGVRLLSNSSSGSDCTLSEEDYMAGRHVVCETTAVESPGQYYLEVNVSRDTDSETASIAFLVEQPVMSGVEPVVGPKSGGVEVVINGSFLDTGNREETRVLLNGVNCGSISHTDGSQIRCISGSFDDMGANITGLVEVLINNAVVSNGMEFEFRDDPVYTAVSPQRVIPAGGIKLNFTGTNLDVVAQPVFIFDDVRVSNSEGGPCIVNKTEMICVIPEFEVNGLPSNISYTIEVGAAPGPNLTDGRLTLDVKPNPVFAEDGSAIDDNEIAAGEGGLITIEGTNLDSVERDEIVVTVGGVVCIERRSEEDINTYVCSPPPKPRDGFTEEPVVVNVGQTLEYNVGNLRYTTTSSDSESSMTIIIIAGSGAGGVFIFSLLLICIFLCCFLRRARAKEKQFSNLLAQMELWEVEMADECKRAFTELQTDLADFVQISDNKNLPYRDFRSFAMRFLFPSAGSDHPVLNPLAVSNSQEVAQHLETFKQLVLNKNFLLVFVRTLEAQHGKFSLQDKCNVASLLMVAFQNDLDYATEILKTLLSEVMHQAVGKSHPKLLLRRTESVAEKMLANWLCFLLFPYLLEHAGEPLFILYRAIKSQLEKGPVDVITGEARHSLSEEKLLRQKFDAKPVDGVVEADSGDLVPVKLLDCDTITQAKEKILDVLYKNTAVSHRPQLLDVDLELRRSNAGIPLRDHDQTNIKDGDWTKINTLGHYRLAEMSQAAIDNPKNPTPRFKLVPRPERPMSGISFDHVGTIIANLNSTVTVTGPNGPNVFHLVKPDQGEGDEGTGPRQGKILSEVFLTRLLSTKRILQSYVDNLFKAIFAVPRGRPLPKAIKCLFDFLDLQASELGIQDPEILHTWKTNSLPLRFWVNLIKNPDFVFDVHKSATVDACLTIIAQAYIDACSTSEIKYTKNTPSAKLLYVNEVRSYKADVQQYYSTVQSLPKLSDHDMAEYLRETAQVCSESVDSTQLDSKNVFMTRQLYFVTESALYELFKYAVTYSEELQEALNEEGLSVMAAKLEQLQGAIKA